MDNFHKMIKKIGEELEIKVTFLSEGWTIILEKNNQIHYITGYQFDVNNHGIGNIMDDKGLFYDLLIYKGLPIIEHYVIFKNYDKKEVLDYFLDNNQEIIVKGNISNAGREVFKINDKEKLFEIIDSLLLKQFSVSLCPFYHIKNEYRIIVLDNKIRNIFGKKKPIVIGDGKKTIQELAFEYSDYYKSHSSLISNPTYIPLLNEEIELNFKFNLTSGAKTFTNIPSDLKKKLTNLALNVTKVLNISFASVDIVYTENNELLVLEANSGVTMNNYILQNDDGYKIAHDIYLDAIKMMFK